MPGGDRRGPTGEGPGTGRAQGYCAGNPEPGYGDPDFKRGGSRGRNGGRRRGRRHAFQAAGPTGRQRAERQMSSARSAEEGSGADQVYPSNAAQSQELHILTQLCRKIEKSLEEIRQRIGALETQSEQ